MTLIYIPSNVSLISVSSQLEYFDCLVLELLSVDLSLVLTYSQSPHQPPPTDKKYGFNSQVSGSPLELEKHMDSVVVARPR